MNGNSNTGGQVPVIRVVSGRTFDGVPFPIALEVNREVDHGATARIYKGQMLAGERLVVAVKVFGQMLGPVEQELLVRELRAARQVSLRHPLILAFLGTADTGQQTSIVSLYMRNGNLLEYLKSHPGCDKKALILQVAEAVNYLHSDEGLVHGDLKCANVLVSDYGEALLADFGLSTFAEKTQSAMATMTGIRQLHTARFAAPELLFGTAPQSKTRESDVYAFGMLVLEAATENPPWYGVLPTELAVMIQVSAGRHPPHPTSNGLVSISHSWWDVCQGCWSPRPGDRPTMSAVLSLLRDLDLDPHRLLGHHPRLVLSVAYFPAGHRAVSGCYGGIIRIWDTVKGRTTIGPLVGDDRHVYCVAVSPDGNQLCTAGEDGTIRRWNTESGTPIRPAIAATGGVVFSVAYSPDGQRIVSGSQEGVVCIWDASTGALLGNPLEGDENTVVWSVAFSTDGSFIAFTEGDTVRLYGSAVDTVLQCHDLVFSVSFSPDGIHLVSGGEDKAIQIWDISSRQRVRTIQGHTDVVGCVAVSSSGRHIASGSRDLTVRIWDTQTGDAVGVPLTGHTDWIRSVAFSSDGRSIVSGSDDTTVRVWDVFE